MKTAFITGASSGFGEAAARIFAEHDYRLILLARSGDKLKKLSDQLHVPAYTIGCDIRDKKTVQEAIQKRPKDFADIDVLVNNAGLAQGLETADKADLDDWDTMIDTNIKGLLYVTRAVLPIMKKQKSGHVVNLGSVAGHAPYLGGNVYGATKAFVRLFSKSLRVDLLGTGIRVTCIEPGKAETNFAVTRYKGDQQKASAEYAGYEALTAHDIAEAIFWAVSRPPHVNIDNIEIMPTAQTVGGMVIAKK